MTGSVAKFNDKVVSFSDLTHNGYLDRLYVHKDYQGDILKYPQNN